MREGTIAVPTYFQIFELIQSGPVDLSMLYFPPGLQHLLQSLISFLEVHLEPQSFHEDQSLIEPESFCDGQNLFELLSSCGRQSRTELQSFHEDQRNSELERCHEDHNYIKPESSHEGQSHTKFQSFHEDQSLTELQISHEDRNLIEPESSFEDQRSGDLKAEFTNITHRKDAVETSMESPYQNQKSLERDFDKTNDTVTQKQRLSCKQDAEETVLKSVLANKCIQVNEHDNVETELKRVFNYDHHSNSPESCEEQGSHSSPGPALTSIEPLSSDSMDEHQQRAEGADLNECSFAPDFSLNLKSYNSN